MGATLGLSSSEPDAPTTVKLHVYDLGASTAVEILNSVLRSVGTGAFHCGVEVLGWEWSFYSLQGVSCCPPQKCSAHHFRETLVLGSTQMTPKEIAKLLAELRNAWPAGDYHVLRRNCCHFCDIFSRRLGVGPVPDWAVHLARMGDYFGLGDIVPKSLGPGGSWSVGGGGADGGRDPPGDLVIARRGQSQ